MSYLDDARDTEEMAVDDGETVERSEDVSETKITLVGDEELESAVSFSLRPRVPTTELFVSDVLKIQKSSTRVSTIFTSMPFLHPLFVHVSFFSFLS